MKNTRLDIRPIVYHTKEYELSLLLRDAVLRKPLGMNLFDENLSKEIKDVHIGAFVSNQLVGVLVLTKVNEDIVKMRQVAIAGSFQKKGIGRQLVEFAESYAKEKGYIEIVLHSRQVSVGFYEKLGYTIEGEPFVEVGIPHKKMFKFIDHTIEHLTDN